MLRSYNFVSGQKFRGLKIHLLNCAGLRFDCIEPKSCAANRRAGSKHDEVGL